ncbi:MAG: hypothetical protein L3J74_09280 [Bacteroidales bacterium]|nr:hypothetical protein [Bacteroidales bacterium]
MKISYFIISVLFFCSLASVKAQNHAGNDSTIYHFKGKVVNDEGNAISFAHIIDLRRGHATISDTSGRFHLPVMRNDSIRISAIGYQVKYVSLRRYIPVKDSIKLTVVMKKKIYDVATVDIYQIRWQVFKAEFMETEVEEDKIAENIKIWMNSLFPEGELRMLYQSGKVGFTIPYTSKDEKQRKKVKAMERRFNIIQPKFNDKLITELTGLKGEDIKDFIDYCNFQEGFLLYATEYEIAEAIQNKWNQYKKVMEFRREFNNRNK